MTEFQFANDEHRQDIIDFINYVFSQAHRPHDFKTLIPKVYADGRGYSDIHAIALDSGYIRGVVAQYPNTYDYAGVPLKTGYIGSVSTYKYTRGSGYMIRLMEMQAKGAEEKGYDVMLLGGQRQRYEYYGFSPIGGMYNYTVISANIRHALKNVCCEGIQFIPFENASSEAVDAAYSVYLSQPVTGARPREDFALILSTWNCAPYVIKKGESVLGYVCAGETDSFSELALADAADAKPVIKAWFAAFSPKRLLISVSDCEPALNREIASFAEGYELSSCFHARIVNLKNLLRATVNLKLKTAGMSDGRLVVKMEDEAPVLIEIKNGEATVTDTASQPDVTLDRLSMQQFLFSYNRYMAPKAPAPSGWFPLPLYLYAADHF